MKRVVSMLLIFVMLCSGMILSHASDTQPANFAYFLENAVFTSANTIELSVVLTGEKGTENFIAAHGYVPLYHPKTGKLMELHRFGVDMVNPFAASGRISLKQQLTLSKSVLEEYRVKVILLESLETLSPVGTTLYQMNEMMVVKEERTLQNVMVAAIPRVNLAPEQISVENLNDDEMYIRTSDNRFEKITVSDTSFFEYIGQQVDITYRADDGDKKVVAITRNEAVKAYENIKLSDVISLSATELVYYADRALDIQKTIQITGIPTVIYNERLHQSGISQINADLADFDGVISVYVGNSHTLIKTKSYKTYVVESTDSRNEIIKVKGAVIGGVAQSNEDIYVPYLDYYTNETVIKRGTFDYTTGKADPDAIALSSYRGIAKGDIIAVASNMEDELNQYYEVLVSSTIVYGTVNEYDIDAVTGRPFVKVGNTDAYLLSKELDKYELTALIQPDMNAKFYLDPFGEVGYISNVKTQDVKLGIPVSVTSGGSGFDKITQLDIYNVDTNKVETLRFRDEVSGDPRVAALKDGSGALITDSLFRYTLKNGQIDEFELITAGSGDYQYVAAKSTAAEVTDIKKVSTKITFDGGKEITYNSTATKIILIGSHLDTDTITPKTTTLTTNTAYTGKVYQLNLKKTGTNYNMQYVIVRPFEGLTKDSPTYIVDSVGSIVPKDDVNVVTVKAYSFTGASKSGNGSGIQEVVMTQNVVNALDLKKGDVFTYYDIPGTTGIDIENLRCVFVLARADEIANGEYPSAGYMEASDNAQAADGYNAGYNFFGIQNNTSNMVGPESTSVYNYYIGTPLTYLYDVETGGERNLRVAKNPVNGLPVLANDTATISALEIDSDNSDNFYDYDINSLANIYVYDAAAADAEKLQQIKGKDAIGTYLEDLQTIENNASNATKNHDTVFVKTHIGTNTNTLYNLYIIKDAR